MKLAIVCDVLGEENNGTTVAAMNLIRYLKSKGHDVRVVCPDEYRRGEPGYYVVPQLNVGPLNNYVRKVGVSIAVSDDSVLESALSGCDAIHIMTPFFLGKAALDYGRKHDIPVTAGFHCQAENITSHLRLMNSTLVNNLTYKAMYRLVYQYVDTIHYPTQFIRDVFEAEVGKTNGVVISNGVNSRFVKSPAERPKEWEGRFVILFTGRYGKEKSHKVLIDAVARSRYETAIQLVFAGEGPLHGEIEKYSEKLTNAPYLHFFSREEMLRTINCADLYVHPAEIEIEAIACLEAISCGLVPVIADSPRSATKYFALGENNLFHYNDPDSLAGKIDYWIEHPAEKEQCSRDYQGFTRRFEQQHCMEEMEKMIFDTVRMHEEKKSEKRAPLPPAKPSPVDPEAFLKSVEETPAPYGTAVLWWLGQMGLWVKMGDTVLSLDYFATEIPGRTIAPPVPAEKVRGITAFLGSHDHIDHIDHPAWKIWAKNLPQAKFVFPELHRERLLKDGIEPERLIGLTEGKSCEVGGITVSAIAAAHEFLDPDPETGLFPALGYIIEGNGLRLYHAGDTLRYEGMIGKLKAFGKFDAVLLPINGRDAVRYRGHCIGNMTFQEAVDLTGELEPRLAIPGHFDMFGNNSEDPQKFADYLDAKYPGKVPCVIPEYGVPIILKV